MRSRFLPAMLLASAISVTASAAPVTYEFAGSWRGEQGSSVPTWHDFGVPYGTVFSGTFTLETETPAAYADANYAYFANPVTALTLNVGTAGEFGQYSLGAANAGGSRSSVGFFNDYAALGVPFDEFDINMNLSAAPGDDPGFHRYLAFNAYTGEWVPGQLFQELPTLDAAVAQAQDPDFLSHMTFNFAIYSNNPVEDPRFANLTGQVTDLHVVTASVPEPATLSLLGIGLLGAAVARRRPSR